LRLAVALRARGDASPRKGPWRARRSVRATSEIDAKSSQPSRGKRLVRRAN
jgi:hypothetical protein